MSSQREAYQLPSSGAGGGGSGGGNAFSGYGTSVVGTEGSGGPKVQYVCGECASKISLGRGDLIRCTQCGHRVLYKERTKRMVQFEAR